MVLRSRTVLTVVKTGRREFPSEASSCTRRPLYCNVVFLYVHLCCVYLIAWRSVSACTFFRVFDSMRAFESDCNDGKGNAVACHQVGEFLSVVKSDFQKAGKLFEMNCETRKHAPSCFNLGRFLRKRAFPVAACVITVLRNTYTVYIYVCVPFPSCCLCCLLVVIVRFALRDVGLQYIRVQMSSRLTGRYDVELMDGSKTVVW